MSPGRGSEWHHGRTAAARTSRRSGTQGPTVTAARRPLAAPALVPLPTKYACAAETSPLTRLTSLTEFYLNAAEPKLFEGIAELAAASDGNDIAILAFSDWEAEGECAVGGAALPLSKRRGGKDVALAVLNGDLSVMADVGVSVAPSHDAPSDAIASTPALSISTKVPDTVAVSSRWKPWANCGQNASTAILSASRPC